MVKEIAQLGHNIKELSRMLGISRALYYKWLNRVKPSKEMQDEQLSAIIIEYNETFDGILRYRRMTDYINHFNQTNYSEKYIHRLMKKINVHARIRRKKSNYVKVKPEQVG